MAAAPRRAAAPLQVHDVLELVALAAGVRKEAHEPELRQPTTPAEMARIGAVPDEAYRAIEDIVGAEQRLA